MRVQGSCMRTRTNISIPIIFLLCVLSCRDNPVSNQPLQFSGDVRFTMVNYNIVQVASDGLTQTSGPQIDEINVYAKGDGQTTFLEGVKLGYSAARPASVSFACDVKLDSTLRDIHLVAEFVASGTAIMVRDTMMATYKFPYANASIVVTLDEINEIRGFFQDIVPAGNVLYYHLTGPHGATELNLQTKLKHDLFTELGGNYLTQLDHSIYFDRAHTSIARFDRDSNKVSQTRYFNGLWVYGMDASDGFLYARVKPIPTGQGWLYKFLPGLTPVDSFQFEWSAYFLAIRDGIFYATRFTEPACIARFDLNTKTFLPDLIAPARAMNGIKFFGQTLFYCDIDKRMIGVVSFSELKPATSNVNRSRQTRRIRERVNRAFDEE